MPDYTAPIADMRFLLSTVLPLDPAAVDEGMRDAILEEAGKLARDVLSPLNATGDKHGARLSDDGVVTTAKGWLEAYTQYQQGGWNAVPFSPDHGGQGLPWAMAFPLQEMWQSANMAFGLCPLLNQGAVEALTHYGTDDQKSLYLPKLITGEWTGTMNLTEPQAGSDLAALRARAEPMGDGTYKITGQKIFITYGEHDLTPNILHLVLARLPDAPDGVKGISLFLVPKFLVNADGSLGARNDVRCVGLEHKLGIHASPTCTISFGDTGGAIGTLVGEANGGLKAMFAMMNNARLSVGLQGVAIAERSLQAAIHFTHDRVQGRHIATQATGPILHHADVMRMILRMQALTMAGRALTYQAASWLDNQQTEVDVLTPIVKSWCTDLAQDVTSLSIQIHGGMGYIEETGVAQFFRDARILPIYEGTNGIQANDLVFRKVLRDKGAALTSILDSVTQVAQTLADDNSLGDDGAALAGGLQAATAATRQSLAHVLASDDPHKQAAIASPFLNLCGITLGGWMMGRRMLFAGNALANGPDHDGFYAHQVLLGRFYADHILPQALGLAHTVRHGDVSVASCLPGAIRV
ncbi:MAG: acyl-CoA dehydrogenase family protein [Pseudomonadota bacterium]